MNPKELIKRLEDSEEFKGWKKHHPGAYLAHIFVTDKDNYDIGYFLEDDDRMASFGVTETVEFKGLSEVFKHPDHKVKALDIEKVNTKLEQALKTAAEIRHDEYNSVKPIKQIVILQDINGTPMWNLTFITENFKTLNIKICAKNGEVKEHKEVNLIQKTL